MSGLTLTTTLLPFTGKPTNNLSRTLVSMTERSLATIRRINEIHPIEGADAIEVAVVGGWKVVVKKGEFAVDQLAVYLEIDSWVPHELAPFLSKGQDPREFNGVKGERLRTVKLRGQISQGLLLNMDVVLSGTHSFGEDADVTEHFGVQKYEKPMNAQLAGMARGNFPSFIPKTDQERIQNLRRDFAHYMTLTWEETEKLDGSSMTVYMIRGNFSVCSRNLDLKETEGNTFWAVARQLDLESKFREFGVDFLAIQGELIGPGIQGNRYALKAPEFRVFDIYDIALGQYIRAGERAAICKRFGLKECPVKDFIHFPSNSTMDSILAYVENKSILNPNAEREGSVFKCLEDPSISFKAISNKFLLKGGE
jgi:RNA ligase (TIGR02306 family)